MSIRRICLHTLLSFVLLPGALIAEPSVHTSQEADHVVANLSFQYGEIVEQRVVGMTQIYNAVRVLQNDQARAFVTSLDARKGAMIKAIPNMTARN